MSWMTGEEKHAISSLAEAFKHLAVALIYLGIAFGVFGLGIAIIANVVKVVS